MYRQILKPIFSLFGQERSTMLFLRTVKISQSIPVWRQIVRLSHKYESPALKRELFGLSFKNPVGLAAGFDTNAECFEQLSDFGFSFIEIGSLSPSAQEGAAKPRVVRSKRLNALITKPGIRNKGVNNAISKLQNRRDRVIISGSIIPNAGSHRDEDVVTDYKQAFSLLYDFVDIITVNISCPDENGILSIQDVNSLSEVLDPLFELRMCYEPFKPILIKVSPDLPFDRLDPILNYCRMSGVDGIIAGNYSRMNAGDVPKTGRSGITGGGFLSGGPLFEKSIALVRHISEYTQGRFPIIGCGGIMNPAQAKQMLDAGASLIQLYSGVVYEGPRLAKKILKAISPK